MRPLCYIDLIPFSIHGFTWAFYFCPRKKSVTTVYLNANIFPKPVIILNRGWKCSSQAAFELTLFICSLDTENSSSKCTFPFHSNPSPVVKNNPRPFFPHMTSRFIIFFATGLLRWNGRMTRRTNAKWPSSEFVAKAQSKAAAVGQG